MFVYAVPSYSAAERGLQATISFNIGSKMGISDAGAIIAQSRGYFDLEDLNVKIVERDTAHQLALSVSETPNAFAVASVFDFLKARAAGQRIVAFASACTRNPIVFYVRRASKIRTVADFVGKTVAYEASAPTAIVFDALIAKNQVSKSSIREVSGALTVAALISHAIDILPGYTSRESYLLSQAGEVFDQISPTSFGLNLPGTVYFTSEETLRSNPEIVRKFLRALIRGWDTAYQKENVDLSTIASMLNIPDLKDVVYLLDQQRPLMRPLGRRFAELDLNDLRDALKILVNQRIVGNSFTLAKLN